MKAVAVICFALVIGSAYGGIVPTTTLFRTPSLDSAIVRSDRVGGSFSYSTVEGHAYTAVSPVIQRVVEPVAVSYTAHQIPIAYAGASYLNPYYTSPVIAAPTYFPSYPHYTPVISQTPGAAQPGNPAAAAPQRPASDATAGFVPGATVDEDTVSVESA